MKPIKLKKWNTRKVIVTTGALAALGAGVVFLGPKYGLVNTWAKEDAVKSVEVRYEDEVSSLETAAEILNTELAEKDSALEDTVGSYQKQLANVARASIAERKRLADQYKTQLEKAGEIAGRDSLDSFFAQHPGFDKNRDYRPSVGYWSSVPINGARDFGDYEVTKRSLGTIFGEKYKEFVDDVLSGRAVLMSGEEARKRTRDPSVRDGERYLFVADQNGNPKGYGMNFEQYRKFKHGGK